MACNGLILTPCNWKESAQRSERGWKNRVSLRSAPARVPRSLPLLLLQHAQAQARFVTSSSPTVFAADNVINLAAPECVILMNQTVFADVVGAIGNVTANRVANLIGHGRGAGGRRPWQGA